MGNKILKTTYIDIDTIESCEHKDGVITKINFKKKMGKKKQLIEKLNAQVSKLQEEALERNGRLSAYEDYVQAIEQAVLSIAGENKSFTALQMILKLKKDLFDLMDPSFKSGGISTDQNRERVVSKDPSGWMQKVRDMLKANSLETAADNLRSNTKQMPLGSNPNLPEFRNPPPPPGPSANKQREPIQSVLYSMGYKESVADQITADIMESVKSHKLKIDYA